MTAALRKQKPWGCFHLSDKSESACGACTSMHSTANVQRAADPRDDRNSRDLFGGFRNSGVYSLPSWQRVDVLFLLSKNFAHKGRDCRVPCLLICEMGMKI